MKRTITIIALITLSACGTITAPVHQAIGAALDKADRDATSAQPIFEASGNAAGVGCSVWLHEVASNLKKIDAMPQEGALASGAALDAKGRALKRTPGFQNCAQLCIENPIFCPVTDALMRALALVP